MFASSFDIPFQAHFNPIATDEASNIVYLFEQINHFTFHLSTSFSFKHLWKYSINNFLFFYWKMSLISTGSKNFISCRANKNYNIRKSVKNWVYAEIFTEKSSLVFIEMIYWKSTREELFDLWHCNINTYWTWCTTLLSYFTLGISLAIGFNAEDYSRKGNWRTTARTFIRTTVCIVGIAYFAQTSIWCTRVLTLSTRKLEERLSEFAWITFTSFTAVLIHDVTIWTIWKNTSYEWTKYWTLNVGFHSQIIWFSPEDYCNKQSNNKLLSHHWRRFDAKISCLIGFILWLFINWTALFISYFVPVNDVSSKKEKRYRR